MIQIISFILVLSWAFWDNLWMGIIYHWAILGHRKLIGLSMGQRCL